MNGLSMNTMRVFGAHDRVAGQGSASARKVSSRRILACAWVPIDALIWRGWQKLCRAPSFYCLASKYVGQLHDQFAIDEPRHLPIDASILMSQHGVNMPTAVQA